VDRLTASSDAGQVRSECLGDFLESIGGSVLQSAEGYGVMRLCLERLQRSMSAKQEISQGEEACGGAIRLKCRHPGWRALC
jgi:hypothetical protein